MGSVREHREVCLERAKICMLVRRSPIDELNASIHGLSLLERMGLVDRFGI